VEIYSLLVIFFSLGLLIFLALRGFSIIFIAPIASIVVILLTQMPIIETLKDSYMKGFVNFAANFYLIFLCAALFGKFMEDSGAARVIAGNILKVVGKNSKFKVLMAVVIITAALTYGGVSVNVVIFTIMPIAMTLFKALNIPWHLFIGAFYFGGATFTLTMLPGAPTVQNIMPIEYVGSSATSGAIIGIVGTVLVIALNSYYLKRELRKSEERGETYWSTKNLERSNQQGDDEVAATSEYALEDKKLPNLLVSLLPPAFLLIILNVFKVDALLSLMLAVVVSIIVFWPNIEKKIYTINKGATNTVLPIVSVCADVGYGTVIAASAGFAVFTNWVTNLPGDPLVSLFFSTGLLAGITGSASGGLGIALETLSSLFMDMGINPDVFHRISAIAASSFDALPHNGGVIAFLVIAGLTHKDAYKHVFFTGVVGPTIAGLFALAVALFMY